MDKDTIKKLTKPFSKDDVKPAPKGKFGSYVPHHLVTKRLNEHAYGQWSHICKEVIRNYKGEVRGVVTTFTLFGVSHDEIGDVDTNDVKNNNTEGELLKLCMSDALKRGAMRHGIGLHLWTGETTEEEHYANKTSELKPKQEQSKKEVAKITNDSAEKFAEDIGAKKKSIGDQLNDILKEMIPNDKKMKEVKTKIYNDMVSSTDVSEDVENWTNKDMDKFLNRVEVFLEDEDIIDVVIGAEVIKECPSCKTTGNIEDNREKKAQDTKFSKIPDFACSNYGENNGCGKGWWISNDDLPTEWI